MSFHSKNQPIFFEGIIEDRNDPLKIGRVKVRAIGYHTNDKTELPTDDLHWAQSILPTTEAGTSGIGSSSKLVEGSYIIGYFRDGMNMQDPIIIGSLQGLPVSKPDSNKGFSDSRTDFSDSPVRPKSIDYKSDGTGFEIVNNEGESYPLSTNIGEADTSRLTRGNGKETSIGQSKENSRNAGQIDISGPAFGNESPNKFSEPENPYNTKYPYNDARETESGHALEFDDTPGSERIHLFHRTGSFIEFHPDGSLVIKSTGNKYNIDQQSSFDHISGSKTIVIDQNMNIKVSGNVLIQIEGNANINMSGGDLNMNVSGNVNQKVSGSYSIESNNFSIKASRIDFIKG